MVSFRSCLWARRTARTLSTSLAVLPVLGVSLHAQEPAPDAVALSPIVVSATRLPTPENDVASSVTVISSADIEAKQQRTLSDVLQEVPGLNLVQTGGPGGPASVFMRGTNSNHTKVVIDGIDVGDPSSPDGAFDFSTILTAGVDRIEVLRGPQSGLYGSDAVGGVVNIITKSGAGPAQFRGLVEGGSFGTFNQSAGVSGSTSQTSYSFDVAHFHASDTPVTPLGLVPPGRPVNGESYDNRTFSLKLGARLTESVDLGLVARYLDSDLHATSDDFLGPEALPSLSTSRALFSRGTAHLALFDGAFDETLGIGYTQYRRSFLDPNASSAAAGLYDGSRIKLDWQGNFRLAPGQVLSIGAEHQQDELANNAPLFARVANDAGYVQLQSAVGGRLFNTVSLRYDDNQQFGGKATYRLAPAFLVAETGTKLKASLGTGFKAPTLDELHDSYPQYGFYGNPALRPETSIGYDAGIEQSVFDARLRFGATYFHNGIRNLIEVNDSYTTYVNIGRATTQGVESFVSLPATERLILRGDYTITSAEDDMARQELLRRPRHKATLTATWRVTEAALMSATFLYVGSWHDVSRDGTTTNVTVPGYALVNLASSYELSQGTTAFARIDNLFDVHYQDPLGFERPGFGVYGGLKVAFEAPGPFAKLRDDRGRTAAARSGIHHGRSPRSRMRQSGRQSAAMNPVIAREAKQSSQRRPAQYSNCVVAIVRPLAGRHSSTGAHERALRLLAITVPPI